MGKLCLKCGKEKESDFFYKDKKNKDGYRYACKACTNETYRKYVSLHEEEIKKYSKEYKLKNKEELRKKRKEYKLKNKEELRKKRKEYTERKRKELQPAI